MPLWVSWGLFNLQAIKTIGENDIGLYKNNRLAILKNKNRPESEKIRKSIQSIYISGDKVENNHPV